MNWSVASDATRFKMSNTESSVFWFIVVSFPVCFACQSLTVTPGPVIPNPGTWSPHPPVHVLLVPLVPLPPAHFHLLFVRLSTEPSKPQRSSFLACFSTCCVVDPCLPLWTICLLVSGPGFDCLPVADINLPHQNKSAPSAVCESSFWVQTCRNRNVRQIGEKSNVIVIITELLCPHSSSLMWGSNLDALKSMQNSQTS